jgi:hypothetical protein
MNLLDDEPLVRNGDDLREGLRARDYGAYAALLLLNLPALHRLEFSDHHNQTLRPFHSVLENVHSRVYMVSSPSRAAEHINAIEEIYVNCDSKNGLQHDFSSNYVNVPHVWELCGIRKLECMIPHKGNSHFWQSLDVTNGTAIQPPNPNITHITKLVFRHSNRISECLRGMLSKTQQLRSLTCELWHDAGGELRAPSISLGDWSEALQLVRGTLKTLVLSVEFCNSEHLFFKQPRVGGDIMGHLDLRDMDKLESLECPVPFISGDYGFSIRVPIRPLLPGLRHLTLRTDMSFAQFPYPFDASVLPTGLSFDDAQNEARYLNNARMDVSYLASATLCLIDQLDLASISVWQSSDPSLDWFDREVEDLVTTCKNKNIAAKLLYPMSMRWKSAAHWNLVNEITMFDPSYPNSGQFPQLFRGERGDIPLGLASQYHLGEFRKRHVRRSRR